eukprot:2386764-Rhodomonas_salina.2
MVAGAAEEAFFVLRRSWKLLRRTPGALPKLNALLGPDAHTAYDPCYRIPRPGHGHGHDHCHDHSHGHSHGHGH